MKYVQINRDITAWAKSIVLGKHRELLEAGDESYVFWGRGSGVEDERCRRFATDFDNYADGLLTRIDGKPGFHSKRATRKLIGWLDEIDPDVVHLHNLLGYYINIELLFTWLASHRCKVIWTLHDCWAFTGQCMHFTYVRCTHWKDGCAASCPQSDTYPETWHRGMEGWNFAQKKRLFTMIPPERMLLLTPSQWLADLVKESFLSNYEVKIRHNTVDKTVFRPMPSDFRERYGIGDRFMVLGVASKWSDRKGLPDFVRLAVELDSERFAVVVVGLSERQIREVQGRIVALPRTDTPRELAEVYTAADVHLQPSVEETFGMTVAEAQSCGTIVAVREGTACEEIAQSDMAVIIRYGENLADVIKRIESNSKNNRSTW